MQNKFLNPSTISRATVFINFLITLEKNLLAFQSQAQVCINIYIGGCWGGRDR